MAGSGSFPDQQASVHKPVEKRAPPVSRGGKYSTTVDFNGKKLVISSLF